jgi:drug/metabolite transporter (DMT)-like permease
MNWVVYPIICAIFWGVGYTLLSPVSKLLNPYTIGFLYGITISITNLIIIASTNSFNDFKLINELKIALYLSFYIMLSVGAGLLFLIGYGSSDINPGIYIIISNSYPIITLLLSYFCFGQTNINPYYASFGVILTLIGCGLLAVAKT